jgi:DNA polymerase V
MLSELVQTNACQAELFPIRKSPGKSERLMLAMDQVNRIMGKETLVLASQGFSQPWKVKQL